MEEANKILGKSGSKKGVERVVPVAKKGKKHQVGEIELKDIVGKQNVLKLADIAINTIKDLAEEDPEEISSIIGVNKSIITNWINEARQLLGKETLKEVKKEKIDRLGKIEELVKHDLEISLDLDEESEVKITQVSEDLKEIKAVSLDDEDEMAQIKKSMALLTKIPSLGKASAEKLINAGIKNIEDLIHSNPEELAEKSSISLKKINVFIENASNI